MLVLGRKLGEKIIIGDDVFIQIIGEAGSTYKIGIDAPKHIKVHRLEVYERDKEKKEAEPKSECRTVINLKEKIA